MNDPLISITGLETHSSSVSRARPDLILAQSSAPIESIPLFTHFFSDHRASSAVEGRAYHEGHTSRLHCLSATFWIRSRLALLHVFGYCSVSPGGTPVSWLRCNARNRDNGLAWNQ